jgi:hypothetical protein
MQKNVVYIRPYASGSYMHLLIEAYNCTLCFLHPSMIFVILTLSECILFSDYATIDLLLWCAK